MYHLRAAAVPEPTLTQALQMQTTGPGGYFDTPLAGDQLRSDNENFAYAMFDAMPASEQAVFYTKMQIPFVADQRLMKLLAAMMYALPANMMNISLRSETTRVQLAKQLAESTSGSLDGLGSVFSELLKDVGGSLSDFFQNLGKGFGKGLRVFGENINRFRDVLIKINPAMRYVTDFLILTPGVKFIFGDLLREVGASIEEGRRMQLLPIAAGYSQYLKDMALILNVASVVLPPPWSMIAKLIAVVYTIGARLIDWQIQQHIESLIERAEEANALVRAGMEQELRATFFGIETELVATGKAEQSLYGANTPGNPTGARTGGMVLIGIAALAAAIILFWK